MRLWSRIFFVNEEIMDTDTIAAIATALSPSGIGIVRISGSEAVDIADKIFRNKNGDRVGVDNFDSHTIHYGFIYDGSDVIDEVLLMIMLGPRSYTAEDTIEINCHGGPFVLKKVLDAVIKNGARLAEPGEFTKRAFMNGRLDLTEAESVMDLIASQNDFARKNSLKTLRGSVYKIIHEMRESILHETAFIEAALDDPEHYSLNEYPEVLKEKVAVLKEKVDALIDNSISGKLMAEGITTAIVGKPNAGKSSILNMLLGEEKAIVTDIAGTTRDAVEASLKIGDIILNVVDTAGIRDTDDVVESIGVDRAKQIANDAELLLYVIDSSVPLDENDDEIIDMIHGRNTIVILNKSDLKPLVDENAIRNMLECPVILTSALDETGVEELQNVIIDMFFDGSISHNDEVYITSQRQVEALRKVSSSLDLVMNSIDLGMSEDLFSIDLMDAYDSLGSIIGEDTNDDLADKIFSDFCMGK